MINYNLKKLALLRFIYFFPIGILIGYIFTIIGSLIYGNGNYISCSPELIEIMGNEINAIIFQNILCGLMSSFFATFSIIFEVEHLNIFKQSIIYYIICVIFSTIIAYFSYWFNHTINGILKFIADFTIYFLFFWILQYIFYKYKSKKINKKLNFNK